MLEKYDLVNMIQPAQDDVPKPGRLHACACLSVLATLPGIVQLITLPLAGIVMARFKSAHWFATWSVGEELKRHFVEFTGVTDF